jgi:hypothetical protein
MSIFDVNGWAPAGFSFSGDMLLKKLWKKSTPNGIT